jgi:hypothetical protein
MGMPALALLAACVLSVARADVVNGSKEPVYVKPENGDSALQIPGGEIWRGQQDGVAAAGRVYKNSDGIDLVVGEDGAVSVLQQNPIATAVEELRGGEVTRRLDGTWKTLFQAAVSQRETEISRLKAEKQRRLSELHEQMKTAQGADFNSVVKRYEDTTVRYNAKITQAEKALAEFRKLVP